MALRYAIICRDPFLTFVTVGGNTNNNNNNNNENAK